MRRIAQAGVLVCLLTTVAAIAQSGGSQTVNQMIPRLIRFSGAVSNADGSPRTGVVGITFALYQDQEGGAPLWQEVQNVQLDQSGHYSVLLGSTKSQGLPADLFTSNEARWLGVEVEQEAEQARILLVSVPYALKAGDAETLGDGRPRPFCWPHSRARARRPRPAAA